jgi:hypothetical protein
LKRNLLFVFLPVMVFTLLGFSVMGYHPGIEDDGVYLAAIKADINPSLYPHDANFFRLQLQATVFDRVMARFVVGTGISVAWAELLIQFVSLFLILWATLGIARFIFEEKHAQWAAVAMVTAMFTLPVAGTALYIADQHLHPRNMATALIMLAVWCILKDKRWQAIPLLLVAILLHPIMGALGISFCVFSVLAFREAVPARVRALQSSLAAGVPLGWIFESPTPSWHHALNTRTYYYLYRWEWYEWLGAIAPLVLFWLLWRLAKRYGHNNLSRLALAVFAYGIFQQIVAMVMLTPTALIRLTPLQPMRYLQLVYIFMAMVGGGLLGRFLLKTSWWRWAIFLLVFNGSMYAVQRETYDSSTHIELPGVAPSNDYLQAFEWIRLNTPTDAYFTLDPRYLAAPHEDFHSFRALAERSQLADGIKDTAVVTQVPELGPVWEKQEDAQQGWSKFTLADFQRLKAEFGVNWTLVNYPQPPAGLDCKWHNATLAVCEI